MVGEVKNNVFSAKDKRISQKIYGLKLYFSKMQHKKQVNLQKK